MKKFGLVAVLILVSLSAVFATDPLLTSEPPAAAAAPTSKNQSVLVNAYLQGYLTLSDMTARHDFMLNTAGATENVANATIATNLKNWNLLLESTTADGTSAALVNNESNRIPYTVSLVGGSNIGTVWTNATLTNAKLEKQFTNRVSNGASGEPITLSITYGAEDVATWFSNMTYTDTLKITVKAR